MHSLMQATHLLLPAQQLVCQVTHCMSCTVAVPYAVMFVTPLVMKLVPVVHNDCHKKQLQHVH
jgi:hypothetical protein